MPECFPFCCGKSSEQPYQKGFIPQKVNDLCFKPVLELHNKQLYSFPQLTSHILQCTLSSCSALDLISSHSLPFLHSSSISGAWLVGGDSEWKDWPHPRELRGVPLTSSPGRAAELYVVSMTTTGSGVVDHSSLPLRRQGA